MQLKGVDFRAVFYVGTKARQSASNLVFLRLGDPAEGSAAGRNI